MKKIMHIAEAFSGGLLTYLISLSNYLSDYCKVIIVYGVRFDTPSNVADLFSSNVQLICIAEFRRNISFIHDIKSFFEIRKLVKQYEPDIIHFHSSKAGFLGRVAFPVSSQKKFYTPHGYCFLKKDDSLSKRAVYYMVEKILAHTQCTTIACGKGEYKYAKELRKNALCVSNGIDTCRIDQLLIKSPSREHRFTVYTAGSISAPKNPFLFNTIAEMCPDICFVWIGDGELRKILTSKNIIITGLVSRDEVIQMAQNYDCYLSCSLWEGLPIALLEAMYMKKICVVSDVTGNHDVIHKEENGFICTDANDFVKTLRKCQRGIKDLGGADQAEIHQFIQNAYQDVLKEYNAKVMADRYSKIYCICGGGYSELQIILFKTYNYNVYSYINDAIAREAVAS